MIVYHGSYTEIFEIDLSKTTPDKDFGRGFYVTKVREQAEKWAARKGEKYGSEGVVSGFKLNESAKLYEKPWQEVYEMLKKEKMLE